MFTALHQFHNNRYLHIFRDLSRDRGSGDGVDPSPNKPSGKPRFTIDILPIVSKEDKFAILTQLSLVQNITSDKFQMLGIKKNPNNSIWAKINRNSYFAKNLVKLGIIPDSQDELQFTNISNCGVLFFKADGVSVYGGSLFIDTKDGLFIGNIDNYLQKGLSELSITQNGAIEGIRNKIKLTTPYSHENGILSIRVKSKFHNVAVDEYCIAAEGTKRVCVLKDNTMRYYTYDDDECFPDTEIFDLSIYGDVKDIATDPNNNFYFIITEQVGVSKLRILNRKTLTEVQDAFEGINKIVHMSHPTGKLLCMDIDGYLRIIQISTNALPRGYVDNNDLTIESNKSRVIQVQDTSRHALAEALANGGITINGVSLDTANSVSGGRENDSSIIQKIWDIPVQGVPLIREYAVIKKTGKDSKVSSTGEIITTIENFETDNKKNYDLDKNNDSGFILRPPTLRELFDAAQTIEEIEVVSRAFDQISHNPTVSQVAGILTPIDRAIREKRGNILIESLMTELDQIRMNLGMMSDFSALIALQNELGDMRQRRSQLSTVNTTLDEGIRDITKMIDEKVREYQQDHADEIFASIDASLGEIGKYLGNIDYMTGLTSVYTYDVWERTESQIAYLSTDKQDTYRDKMHTLVKSRQGELQKALDTVKSNDTIKLKKKLSEVEGYIGQIEDIVGAVDSEKTLTDIERNDPLIARIRAESELLQPSERDRLLLLLDSVFRDRARDIRLARLDTKGATTTLDEYGLDTGLYYSERGYQAISYTVGGKRTPSGSIRLELRLQNGSEHVYDFDKYLSDPSDFAGVLRGHMAGGITPEMTQVAFVELQSQIAGWRQSGKTRLQKLQSELSHAHSEGNNEKQQEILEQIKKLKSRYQNARFTDMLVEGITREKKIDPRPHLQSVNDRFIVLDEERDIIKKLSDGMMIQKETGKGIDILEGPPGLGKTEIVRFVAGVTNREIIRVQCAKMDPSDMFFSPQLKAGETSRQPAEWIQLMQKPGVVVLFDEIDKLSSECFDRLHSLFDGGRSVFDPQIGSFKVNKDAVFLGTRNSYEKMTNPITSRGTIILMNSPGEMNEAFKVSKYTNLPYFEKMTFVEFQKQYTKYTSRTSTTDQNEKIVANIFGYIRSLVSTLNALRTKQKSEDYSDKFEYELSYRDAEQIFLRYNRNPGINFKDKVAEVLIPKVRAVVLSSEDKTLQEKLATDIIDANF